MLAGHDGYPDTGAVRNETEQFHIRIYISTTEELVTGVFFSGVGAFRAGRREISEMMDKYEGHVDYVRTERDFNNRILGEIVLKTAKIADTREEVL